MQQFALRSAKPCNNDKRQKQALGFVYKFYRSKSKEHHVLCRDVFGHKNETQGWALRENYIHDINIKCSSVVWLVSKTSVKQNKKLYNCGYGRCIVLSYLCPVLISDKTNLSEHKLA